LPFGRGAATRQATISDPSPDRGRAAPLILRPLGLLACLVSVATCQSPAEPDLAALDRAALAQIEAVLSPIPRFSGSRMTDGSLKAMTAGTCSPVLLQPVRPPLGAGGRRRLAELGWSISRIVPSPRNAAPRFRLQALRTLLGEPTSEGRQRAVHLFQNALARDPGSAARKNDLAAAHLLRGRLDGEPGELAAALELLEPITAERTAPPDALFNQGYALQCLTLWDAARDTWRRVPGAVAPGARTGEAAAAGNAEPGPLQLRRRGEWLLGEWAQRGLASDLAAAEALGARLEARNGDRLLSAAAGVIAQALKAGDRARLRQLRQGHAAFHQVRGQAIYSQCLPKVLSAAEASLLAAGSPFAGWVQLDEAVCAYFDKDFHRAETILLPLRANARGRGFPSLAGRADWMLGLVRMVQGRFVEADRYYSEGIDLFSRLGEAAHAVYLQSLRARSYDYGGARQEAWHERLTALALRRAVDDPERLFTIFDEAAQALRRQGFPVAALGFLDEQMRAAERAARETGKTDLLAFAHMYRAELLAEIGRRPEAAADVARAAEACSWLPSDNESRRRLLTEIGVQKTLLRGTVSPDGALRAIDAAITFFTGPASALGDQVEILKLYKLRAQLELDHGRFAAARDDLLRGIAEVERQRLEVAAMDDRARFLTQGRGLFLTLMRLELDRLHDPEAALATLERSSNRVHGDTALARLGAPAAAALRIGAETLRAAFPPATLVVRYGHLNDRLLLWTFRGGRLELEQRPMPDAELARQVQLCRDLLSHGASPTGQDTPCDTLAQTALPRRLRELPAGTRILLIPDEALASLPFAALRISPRGPRLVERFRLSYAPSLTSWLAAVAPRRPPGPPRTALFVSDPAFSRELFNLSRLPAARKFVAGYASHYSRAEILSDQKATAAALLASLDRFEILHFDGHGLTNFQYPERGGLLLAPAHPAAPDLRSSLLTAADLPPRSLRRLRLVILGACSTGLTTYRETAEVTGLAAAFLARGVPEVVAAAWTVPDEPSARLLDRFHQELAAGRPTDEALQTAQLALLHSALPESERTTTWAAFQVFQGGR
jgi:tetratricopeptide (TPR) repeat protein